MIQSEIIGFLFKTFFVCTASNNQVVLKENEISDSCWKLQIFFTVGNIVLQFIEVVFWGISQMKQIFSFIPTLSFLHFFYLWHFYLNFNGNLAEKETSYWKWFNASVDLIERNRSSHFDRTIDLLGFLLQIPTSKVLDKLFNLILSSLILNIEIPSPKFILLVNCLYIFLLEQWIKIDNNIPTWFMFELEFGCSLFAVFLQLL